MGLAFKLKGCRPRLAQERNHPVHSRAAITVLVAILTLLAAPSARGEFTLAKKAPTHDTRWADRFSLLGTSTGEEPAQTAARQHPWRAALETFTVNIGVWAFDRLVLNDSFSHIGWSSWKKNLREGFGLDNDGFVMNLFGHPYQGSLYFNAARSMGMSFWQSAPYVFGGSLMWELFMENSRPSTDDLIYTTAAGIYLGELLYRMSSQVLDDSATGGSRVWRECVGFVLDPVRGLNRVVSGDAWRTASSNGQRREIMTGGFSLGAAFFDERPDLPKAHSSTAIGLDFQYGDWCQCLKPYHPFDLIAFDGTIRFGSGSQIYSQLSTYAPLFATQRENAKGQRLLYGLFEDYDYIKNEGLQLGGVSLTGGVLATLPLGARSSFQAAAQAGSVVWGGSNSVYFRVEDRDYNYSMGPVLKLESAFTVKGLGGLSARAAHYQLFTVGGAPTAADVSHDMLTTLKTLVDVHLLRKTDLRFEYTAFFRHTHFNGHPEFTHYYYQLQGDLVFGL